jgi:L-2,4-diaminobutyric acid acetyltransferase
MLLDLISREACAEARALKTTITRDNDASWGLFTRVAEVLDGDLSDAPHFERDAHFDGEHATEHMVTIRLPEPARLASAA